MTIDIQNIKPLYRIKKNPQVTDPQRIPKLMEPLEKQMKESYAIGLNKMLSDITVKMVQYRKTNRK